jgi:PAS domain S-box-containing protein
MIVLLLIIVLSCNFFIAYIIFEFRSRKRGEYKNLVENANNIIIRWDRNGNYTFLNQYAEKFFGYNHQDLIGKPVLGNTVPSMETTGKSLETMLEDILEHPDNYIQNVNEVITKDQKRYWMQWANNPIYDRQGRVKEIQSIGMDITEKKQAEQRIEASLREKEILLKEIHHRVKNNLQIVSSLLNLQSLQIADKALAKSLTTSRNRIHSMALVHEKLYQSENLSRVDFKQYIKELTLYLFDSYDVKPEKIESHFDLQTVTYAVDIAIPCGLIVHELVSNALQHAFPGNRSGTISISLRDENGATKLSVGDDGVGLPAGKDIENEQHLGLQLVDMLTDQLKGTVSTDRSSGTRFSIEFPSNGQ